MTFLSPEDYEKIDHLRGEIEEEKRRRAEYLAGQGSETDEAVQKIDEQIAHLRQELKSIEG